MWLRDAPLDFVVGHQLQTLSVNLWTARRDMVTCTYVTRIRHEG
jgi:hypothetical protein